MFPPNTLSTSTSLDLAPGGEYPTEPASTAVPVKSPYDSDKLLAFFEPLKRESTEYRWLWEREWLRDLYYVANRQWIMFHPARREWVDKRLQKGVPHVTTNKMAEIVQAIRTNLAAINLAVTIRPVGNDTQSIAAAEIADQMSPLIHEEHNMSQVMREADFWLITCGNAALQTSWNRDSRWNKVFIPSEQCAVCQQALPPKAIVDAGHHCPNCGGTFFTPAQDPSGQPAGEWIAYGRGKTTALSPFEYAFPPNITNFADTPYIIRLRWRDKHYFEANHPELCSKIVWEKSPSDRSLQIFKSLALMSDVGSGSQFAYLGSAGTHTVEGVTEYELWHRPTPAYPQGLVMRTLGDKSPIIMQAPEEGIPGPLPFTDIEGNPIFPFVHAQYEHMGGRVYGRGALSPLIQKQDQLNQLDSLIMMHVQRNANGTWVVPENAGIENLTGGQGLIIKWNVLAAGGQGKPERVPGLPIDASLFEYRSQLLKDIEELSGAFDIIKGQKPSGIEAFSALQLLVERSQSRFTSVFQARGEMYRKWYAIALELERQFGPDNRVWAVVGPNRGYTFRHFQHAQLQAQVSVHIEDGSNVPKTALGKRAAIEQANQLRLLNPDDPDQKYALLSTFGLADLVPSLNYHVQAALQQQDAFEKWTENPVGPSPLVLKPWHDAQIHLNEVIKWLNADKMRELLATKPQVEVVITQYLQSLMMSLMPMPGEVGPDGKLVPTAPTGSNAPGGGQAMTNSNVESAGLDTLPSGNRQTAQNFGPM